MMTAQYKDRLDAFFREWFARFSDEPQRKLYDAMQYSLTAGGKRLRPILTFEFCRMCGADWENATPFAAAVEMIHTYSLIHDDLPCMDNDDFRRGKPTNHKVFGEATAVLAGDALLTDAFAVASMARVEPQNLAYAVFTLSECVGSAGMVGGQVLDMTSEERELSEQEVLAIQSRKTGALLRAACVLGVIAGGGSQEQLDAAARFATALGLAFQIRDDMLDVIGTSEELGKGIGTDAKKNTFVRLYGLDECERLVERYTDEAVEALAAFPDSIALARLALELARRRS